MLKMIKNPIIISLPLIKIVENQLIFKRALCGKITEEYFFSKRRLSKIFDNSKNSTFLLRPEGPRFHLRD